MSKIYFFLFAFLCLFSCTSIYRELDIQEDNIVEEFVEGIVKGEVGIEIDFTPSSKEK